MNHSLFRASSAAMLALVFSACSGTDSPADPTPAASTPTKTEFDDVEAASVCDGDRRKNCVEAHADAQRVDDEAKLGFKRVDFSEDGTMEIELSPGAALPTKIAAGKVLYRGRKDKKPFIRRIDAVERTGDVVKLKTSKAGFKDAFRKGNVRARIPLGGRVEAPTTKTMSLGEVSQSLEVAIGPDDCSGVLFDDTNAIIPPSNAGTNPITFSAKLSLSKCKFRITAWADAYIHWDSGVANLDSAEVTFGGSIDAALHADLTFSADGTVTKEIEIFKGPPVPFTVAGIVIVATPTILGGYSMSASATFSASAGFDYTGSMELGFGYSDPKGYYAINDSSQTFTHYGPNLTFNGNVSGSAWLRPKLDLQAFGFVGGYATLKAYAALDVTGSASYTPASGWKGSICSEIKAGLQPSLGVSGDVLGFTIFDQEWVLKPWETSLYDECTGAKNVVTANPSCGTGSTCTADAECNAPHDACHINKCSGAPCACTLEKITGCCLSAADCNDGNDVTTDSCANGVCLHLAPPEPPPQTGLQNGECVLDSDCADGDINTTDTCTVSAAGLGTCAHAPKAVEPAYCTVGKCDDKNAGTTDKCDEATKTCSHAPKAGGGAAP